MSRTAPRFVSLPVVHDAAAAQRAHEAILAADPALGERLAAAPAAQALVAGVTGASPYLTRLITRVPQRLSAFLDQGPEAAFAAAEARAAAAGDVEDLTALGAELRQAKADAHLVAALADLSGDWDVWRVVAAITAFADRAVETALGGAYARERARASLPPDAPGAAPPGYFVLAMGKHGAGELNYSSDIDLTVFYDRTRLGQAGFADPARAAIRMTQAFVNILHDVTADGYVFRVDLRLRPDPGATAPAVSTDAALRYYGGLGQTWERAAFIKARPVAGDLAAAEAFLGELSKFVWRRSLDFAALDDIHGLMRQVRAAAGEGVGLAGVDLKRGRGGVREIEFFAQCQQLIYGGREQSLQRRASRDALHALVQAGHVAAEDADQLLADYAALRDVEHRLQMLEDQPTHRVPDAIEGRARLAALCGYGERTAFEDALSARMRTVRRIAGTVFRDDEPDDDLVIDPIDDTEASQQALRALGFEHPQRVTERVRAWMAGRSRATRSKRAQLLVRRVLPQLARACGESAWPDEAFRRFAAFFEELNAGVQTLSLFVSEPALLRSLVQVIALSPRLGETLAAQPGALEVMLDASFAAPLGASGSDAPGARAATVVDDAGDFETALNAARRVGREQRFRIGAHVLLGQADARAAGAAFSDLADGMIASLLRVALAEVAGRHGDIDVSWAVIGLGKLGGRELSIGSDLDLMVIYEPGRLDTASTGPRVLTADDYAARLTQRLVAALSAPTEEGGLYDVDLQLRPSGSAGPIAVRRSAFLRYYAADAWTWEMMALTRARVVAGDDALAARVSSDVAGFLARPRDRDRLAADARDMREKVAKERRPFGRWDLKLAPGGLMDVEFAAQVVQLAAASQHRGVLATGTASALSQASALGVLPSEDADALMRAARLQLDLAQLLSLISPERFDVDAAPPRLKAFMASASGHADFAALDEALQQAQSQAHQAFRRLVDAGAEK